MESINNSIEEKPATPTRRRTDIVTPSTHQTPLVAPPGGAEAEVNAIAYPTLADMNTIGSPRNP